MEKRKEIDSVNILLCILVMLIHILSRSVASLDKASIQYLAVLLPSRLASFVVQGFILLSGMKYFMKYEKKDFKYIQFIISRAKTILLPYIIWNVIYYLALIPLGYFKFNILELLKYIMLGNMISHFYFVVIIMQFYLLMPLWFKLFELVDEKVILIISLVLMIVYGQYLAYGFNYNDRIFFKYIFYWILGCIVGRNANKFFEFINRRKTIVFLCYSSIALIDGFCTYYNNTRGYVAGLENIHIIYCSATIIFVFAICGKLGKFVDRFIYGLINRQSYNIYLSHCLVLYFCDGLIKVWGIYSARDILLLRLILCYLGTLCLWWAYDRLSLGNRAFVVVDRAVDSPKQP